MSHLLARRFIAFVVTLICASMIIFSIMDILPGDPAMVILGMNAEDDTLNALRIKLGLHQPITTRYFTWIFGFVTGNFGESYTYSVPVSQLIGERISLTLPLAIMAIILTIIIAVPAGLIAASRHNRITDFAISTFAQIGVAIPNFWFAQLLIMVFAINLAWLPAGGFIGWEDNPLQSLYSLLLPAIALALPQAAILTRVMRSSTLDTLREDYVRTARAKGLSHTATLWQHVLRNALIPVITIMGLQFSFLISGTIIIENVFYLPGIGRLLFQAITQRDLIVVQNIIMLLVASVIIVNFIVDIAYMIIDPRLRRGHNA